MKLALILLTVAIVGWAVWPSPRSAEIKQAAKIETESAPENPHPKPAPELINAQALAQVHEESLALKEKVRALQERAEELRRLGDRLEDLNALWDQQAIDDQDYLNRREDIMRQMASPL